MPNPAPAPAPREYPGRPLVGIGIVLLRPAPPRSQISGVQTLLIRRARPPAAGQWSLPGGAQRLGETAEAAARRELLEETGLTAGPMKLAAHVDSIHPDQTGAVQYHYTILDFACLWQAGEPKAGGDANDVKWATEAEFDSLDLWPEARRVIAAARVAMGV
jgi:8-oxo-dGTP diphosphatase